VPARGDQVTVELVEFSTADAAAAQAALDAAREAEAAERTAETVRTAITAGVIALVVVGAGVAAFVIMRRRREAAEAAQPVTLLQVEESLDPFDAITHGVPAAQIAASVADETPTIRFEPEPDPEPEAVQVTLDRRRSEIGDLARRDPARTADLLRRLVRDSQNA